MKLFTVKIDGKDVEFQVRKPTQDQLNKAQRVQNRVFREAVEGGAILRAQIEAVMRQRKLWDDEKQKERDNLLAKLLEGEKKLATGKIKLSEARKIALEMRGNRWRLVLLNRDRNELDGNTAEAQAENARFNALVSMCTVYAKDGKPYYESYEDYLGREDDPVALPAASHFGRLYWGVDDEAEKKLPENKFLLKYKMCDEKMRLVDQKGRWVDEQGKLLDEQGRLINDKGELVDFEGNLITEEGEYKVDFKEFDNDWNPPAKVDKTEPVTQ
jgi:hypothetical protein